MTGGPTALEGLTSGRSAGLCVLIGAKRPATAGQGRPALRRCRFRTRKGVQATSCHADRHHCHSERSEESLFVPANTNPHE